METIGTRIRRLREERCWSQEQLAQEIGIAREALSAVENAKRDIKAAELGKIADVLGVSTDQLLGRVPLTKVTLGQTSKAPKEPLPRINVPAKNVSKFREVLLYILNKVGARPNVGQTVLYKMLYFIDFDYYEKYEEQIIGATYQKNHFGPTPIEFKKIVEQMIQEGDLELVKSKYFQKEQVKYLPHRSANLALLSAREVQLVDEVVNRLADKSASQVSEYSHGDVPWQVTDDMEYIDYETVFYRTAPYSVRGD